MVEPPRRFSYAELKAMPKQDQITTYFCIQGWSGVREMGGTPMRHFLEFVRPRPLRCLLLVCDGGEVGVATGAEDHHGAGIGRRDLSPRR